MADDTFLGFFADETETVKVPAVALVDENGDQIVEFGGPVTITDPDGRELRFLGGGEVPITVPVEVLGTVHVSDPVQIASSEPLPVAGKWPHGTGGPTGADSVAPVVFGGVARLSEPDAVTEGDAVRAYLDEHGRQHVQDDALTEAVVGFNDEAIEELQGLAAAVADQMERAELRGMFESGEALTYDTNMAAVFGTANLIDLAGRLKVAPQTLDTPPIVGSMMGLNSQFGVRFAGMVSATVTVYGTWTGTLTFEATADGGTWAAIMAQGIGATSSASTATGGGIYRLVVNGLTGLRLRFTTATSGTPQVSIVLSATPLWQQAPSAVTAAQSVAATLQATVTPELTAIAAARQIYWNNDSPVAWTPAAPLVQTTYTDPKWSRLPRRWAKPRVEVSGSEQMPIAQQPHTFEMLTRDHALYALLEEVLYQLKVANQLAIVALDDARGLAEAALSEIS